MKPKGEGWHKVPSVTSGGKPFFWWRRTPAGKCEWFVWSRRLGAWEYREVIGS
jgi:hypothetical protein